MVRSVMGFAKVLALALGGLAVLEAVRTVVSSLWLAGALPDEVAAIGVGGMVLVGTLTFLAVLPALAFFTWRTATNVRVREPDFTESPGGGAVAWFVPGWNLYKPYDALSTIWSATANLLPGDEPRGPGRLLDVFWVSWVVSVVAGRVFGGGSEDALLGLGDVVAAGAAAVSYVAGAMVVVRLAGLQEEVVA